MQHYNILCATDDNYVPYCGIMLTSLFENNKEADINVYILTENLNDINKEKIKNKIVLIIDDVVTTGATVSEIARLIKKNGAKECLVLSFAHTRIKQDN